MAHLHVNKSMLPYPNMDGFFWLLYLLSKQILFHPREFTSDSSWNLTDRSCSIIILVLKLKLIKRMKGIQRKTSEDQASWQRGLIYLKSLVWKQNESDFMRTAHLLYPHSHKCQYQLKSILLLYVSLLDISKVAVLLMVKPLWSGDVVRGPAALQWLSRYDSVRQRVTWVSWKQKPHCHNNKSRLENEVF